MTEELYNKIDKFCNETDWGKYPTYEHALEEFIKGIVAEATKKLEKENAELKAKWLQATDEGTSWYHLKSLEKENAELKEKFLKIKADDVRKSKLDSFKTLEEKNEYLRQVANYAIFNEDISVMFWCFVQRGDIYTDQHTKAKELLEELYDCIPSSSADYYKETLQKVADFLKDSEVEK